MTSVMRSLCALACCVAFAELPSMPAWAQQDAGAPPSGDAGSDETKSSCVEHIPEGATRRQIYDVFPSRGQSGYVARLDVFVIHGKGETVLPEGLKLQTGSDAARALEAAGFVIPDPDGGAGPTLATEPANGDNAKTNLSVAFVPLPREPGRHELVLPPLPIAVARASGEVMTLCTAPHRILVEDPIANELTPKVRPNPTGRHQREEWVLARDIAIGLLIGTVVGLLIAWLLRRWARRPKPVPVVPRKLPWIEALEELAGIRRSNLLVEHKTDAYFDRVSDCVRKYLGARYGFDGLESTTDEIRTILRRIRPAIGNLTDIGTFLSECDLVKFARVLPTEQDCIAAVDRGELIVRATIPHVPENPSRAASHPPPQGPPPVQNGEAR